jgi:uncharacterized protein with PQ loop repeat
VCINQRSKIKWKLSILGLDILKFDNLLLIDWFGINCSPTFYKIIKKKDVEEFKPDPYLATVLNCAFWVFYGMPFVHPNSLLVVTINGVGLVFRVCLSYHLLCLCRERRKGTYYMLLVSNSFEVPTKTKLLSLNFQFCFWSQIFLL